MANACHFLYLPLPLLLKDYKHSNKVNEASDDFGIKVNVRKTKFMIISKTENVPASLTINCEPIERCSNFKYLSCKQKMAYVLKN
jgi:hypothetical protein